MSGGLNLEPARICRACRDRARTDPIQVEAAKPREWRLPDPRANPQSFANWRPHHRSQGILPRLAHVGLRPAHHQSSRMTRSASKLNAVPVWDLRCSVCAEAHLSYWVRPKLAAGTNHSTGLLLHDYLELLEEPAHSADSCSLRRGSHWMGAMTRYNRALTEEI